jgi:putative intracellular protease/amidase
MAATQGTKPTYRVAVLLFPGADVLDYAGPIEMLSSATHNKDFNAPEPVFDIQTVAREKDVPISTGHEDLLIQPHIFITELLETLERFHFLIVPGGRPAVMEHVIGMKDGMELEVIKAFTKLPPATDGQERIMLSVCTGALLLGAAGVLSGLKVTTHHLALDQLRMICDRGGGGSKTEVIGGQRFVDAGVVKDGLRIVTAGGVSSGLDAALHLVELVKDRDTADAIAGLTEYERRQV